MDSLRTHRKNSRHVGDRVMRPTNRPDKARRREGRLDSELGQAFVLSALTLFILSAMTMMSFSLGNAIHERIRIQHHADAAAYSMAVQTARTFNYFAYSNRAIAAGYAAMTTMHAYMASLTVTYAMLKAAEMNYWIIMALEFLKVLHRWCPPGFPCAFEHIPHAIKAIREAREFRSKANDQADKIADADKAFQDTVNWLNRMLNLIHQSQAMVLLHAVNVVSRAGIGDDPIERLDELNAPDAIWGGGTFGKMAIGGANARSVSCAVDGIDLMMCGGPDSSDEENRRKVMASVADGTRADLTAKRPFFPYHLITFVFGELQPDKAHDQGICLPLFHGGTAKLTTDIDDGELHSKEPQEGQAVGADEHGGVLLCTNDQHCMAPIGFVWGYGADVYTKDGGGRHASWGWSRPGGSPMSGDFHDGGDHDDFDGIESNNRISCAIPYVGSGLCFMKFRADPDPENHFGQPALYAAYAQDLGLVSGGGTLDGGTRGAWEVNDDGEIRIQGPNIRKGDSLGEGQGVEDGISTGTLTLRPGDGLAVSKALVYYHRMGNWREQPNFFNPYWRAKLHPFTSVTEAMAVAGAAGRPDASLVYAAEGFLGLLP